MDRMKKINEMLLATPNDSFLHHALALEYIKLGEEQEAKKHLEFILANNSDYVGSYYHLGKLLERINETENAIRIYEEGIVVAKKLKDIRTMKELEMALESITNPE